VTTANKAPWEQREGPGRNRSRTSLFPLFAGVSLGGAYSEVCIQQLL
jgi:hypothetical protein